MATAAPSRSVVEFKQLRHRAGSVNHLRADETQSAFGTTVQNLIGPIQCDVYIILLHIEIERRVGLHCGYVEGLAALVGAALEGRVHDVVADR